MSRLTGVGAADPVCLAGPDSRNKEEDVQVLDL